MRKLIACLVLMCVPSLSSQEPTTIFVADHDWAPFLFAGKADAPIGLARELVEKCLNDNGYLAEYRYLPIKRVWPALREGTLDLNVMSLRPDRLEWADYGARSLFTSSYHPFVLAGSGHSVDSLEGLRPLRLGHLSGMSVNEAYEALVEEKIADGSAVTVTSQEALIKMLLVDRIDAFVLPKESASWHAHELGVVDEIQAQKLSLRSSQYFLAVSKTSRRIAERQAFLDQMDGCFAAMNGTEELTALFAEYGLEVP